MRNRYDVDSGRMAVVTSKPKPLSEETIHHMQRIVCGSNGCKDKDDAKFLLEILGIFPGKEEVGDRRKRAV